MNAASYFNVMWRSQLTALAPFRKSVIFAGSLFFSPSGSPGNQKREGWVGFEQCVEMFS